MLSPVEEGGYFSVAFFKTHHYTTPGRSSIRGWNDSVQPHLKDVGTRRNESHDPSNSSTKRDRTVDPSRGRAASGRPIPDRRIRKIGTQGRRRVNTGTRHRASRPGDLHEDRWHSVCILDRTISPVSDAGDGRRHAGSWRGRPPVQAARGFDCTTVLDHSFFGRAVGRRSRSRCSPSRR